MLDSNGEFYTTLKPIFKVKLMNDNKITHSRRSELTLSYSKSNVSLLIIPHLMFFRKMTILPQE